MRVCKRINTANAVHDIKKRKEILERTLAFERQKWLAKNMRIRCWYLYVNTHVAFLEQESETFKLSERGLLGCYANIDSNRAFHRRGINRVLPRILEKSRTMWNLVSRQVGLVMYCRIVDDHDESKDKGQERNKNNSRGHDTARNQRKNGE